MLRWWLNPLHLRDGVRDIRRILRGGGPKLVRLAGVGQPKGLIFPAAAVRIEVEARDGTKVELDPRFPVPFPYAWAYRLARRLDVPLVGVLDPDRLRFELAVPRRG